jgi:putative DNA primase/helicase
MSKGMSRQDFTFDDIENALRFLDCEDTDVWLRAGMAIKSEFGESGFGIWDAWSQGDSRYREKEARARWKSFKGGSARGSVSIGTVLHWAFERGFRIERPELTGEQKAAFAAEQEARRKRVAEQAAVDAANEQRWYDAVANVSQQIMPLLKTVGSSPYLGKKKIPSCGCLFPSEPFLLDFKDDFTIDVLHDRNAINAVFARMKANKAAGLKDADTIAYAKRGDILIPLFNERGELRNFQIIHSNGEKKRFLAGGQKTGLWFLIKGAKSSPDSPLIFCEGFATGASDSMATGWDVVVTFDAGNMPAVAEKFVNDPRSKIFAGDNDWETALDPKKKNAGTVKAQEAARIVGGTWCVPQFIGDAAGLSDFNDLHVTAGLDAVRMQICNAQNHIEQPLGMVATDSPIDSAPPDYGDIPVAEYEDYLPQGDDAGGSPIPTHSERPTLESVLLRYALAMPDAKVWDSHQKRVLKQGAAKAFFGAKLFGEWLGHEKIRTVELADVQREAAAAQAQGGGGLADAIGRYVYLYPSSTAWDSHTSQQVALSDLRNAIADCYDQWLKHPKRRNMPKENLVFDPTQQVVTGEYINTFRGLPLVPVRNDDACRNMRHMLWCLCNKNDEIFTWICQWLAFPLQHVGAKMQTAVLMHSRVHGSGKSFFFDGVMRAVYGEYCRTFGQAELESQYNDWISQALFGVFEEVLSRSQRYSHTGTLKQMITGEKVRINQKYMQGWEESNHLNCVFLSNEVEPLPVEPSDRRLLVIWPEEKLLDELQTGVDAELKAGGAAAFYDWLLRVDTSNFTEHAKPPMTDAKKRLIDIGRPAWEVFYEDWKNLRTDAPYCSCRVIDLYRLYQGWAKMRNENVLAMNRFSGYIASYERRRPDLHYEQGSLKGKSSFFIVGQCPAEKNQSEWLAGCVGEFDRILRVDHQDAA